MLRWLGDEHRRGSRSERMRLPKDRAMPPRGSNRDREDRSRRRGWVRSVVFTAGVLGLISLSVEHFDGLLLAALIGSVAALVVAFHYVFPGGVFFSFALANLIGFYACVFIFFVESHYQIVDSPVLPIGFVAPLIAFFAGAVGQRRTIRSIIASARLRDENRFGRVLSWLGPVLMVAALNFFIPESGVGRGALDALFLGAMAAISVVVFFASREVAAFLLDTGLLFEEFFERVVRLVVPAFAFLTFYSLVVIVFASIYSALDHLTHVPHFRIDGAVRELSFSEGLYFSLTTISTVGYGDITPATNAVRILVSIEIVSGLLLLLFGFNEIITYSRDRRRGDAKAAGVSEVPR
jgi:voltage-gated potassium channel